ncbi:hypothetical protein [Mesorhizobium sp. M0035]|uniref:hypothetical protein n=1 Tax=Mesorhizobium sp. M0035 TaxID=2956852 RepID=UPI0033356977
MSNVIRIADLGRWTFIPAGDKLTFSPHKARTIRLDLRASAPAYWAVERITSDGEVKQEFLTITPPGVSTLEIGVGAGNVALIPQIADGEDIAFSAPEYERFDLEAAHPGETFLKIAHRRQRNPEVEYMEFLMNQNMEARLRTMDEEIARRLSAIPTGAKEDDGNGVHEQPAAKREKLPQDAKGKAGKAGLSADGAGQQLHAADDADAGAAAGAGGPSGDGE